MKSRQELAAIAVALNRITLEDYGTIIDDNSLVSVIKNMIAEEYLREIEGRTESLTSSELIQLLALVDNRPASESMTPRKTRKPKPETLS